MKVELWGTYPPPIGGVSIHIYRLFNCAIKHEDIICKDFNGTGTHSNGNIKKIKFPLIEFLKLPFEKKKVIHLHSAQITAFLLVMLLGRKHHIIITIHGKVIHKTTNRLKVLCLKRFYNRVEYIIMNDKDYAKILSEKFDIEPAKIKLISAYIKPLELERGKLPQSILNFRSKKTFLISANGYRLYKNEEGDVYGFDLLIELMHRLKEDGIMAGLVFCLPQTGDEFYVKECQELIHGLNLDEDILVYNKPIPNGFQVWEISDLFIRPTLTDIEGLSVKEALHFGTPTIASDVCVRPYNTLLFKKGNINDLYEKTIDIIKNYKRIPLESTDESDTVNQILSLYNSLKN